MANRAKGGGCECEGEAFLSKLPINSCSVWRGLKQSQRSVTVTTVVYLCSGVEYYPNCEVMFMGMANIHAIRNSFQALRTVCSQIPDPGK